MTLLDDFNDASDTEFLAKVLTALVEKAKTELATLLDVITPAQKRKARTVRSMIQATTGDSRIIGVSRILVSEAVTNASTDAEIQTEVTARFAKIEFLFDPALDT